MKTLPVALAAEYASPASTIVACLEIVRADGYMLRLTEAAAAFPVDGDVYLPGLRLSEIVSGAGLAVDNLEVTLVPTAADSAVARADVIAGLWDHGQFRLFECNRRAPADGINLLRRGWTGNAQIAALGFTLELRSLKQALQQSSGAVTTKTCRYRLGSTAMPDGLCFVALGPWTHTLLVTAVTHRGLFTCSAASALADDYFGDGTVTFNDGENALYSGKVKTFAAGVFTLSLLMPFDVTVGDELVAVAGCRKRLLEDCKVKFDNVFNFGGEPHVPGPDALTKDPEISAA